MTFTDRLFGLLLLTAVFWWLLKRLRRFNATQVSETTTPLTPDIPVLKPFIYLWWLLTGLWLERIESVHKATQPFQHRLSIIVHQIALVLIFGIFVAVLVQWVTDHA